MQLLGRPEFASSSPSIDIVRVRDILPAAHLARARRFESSHQGKALRVKQGGGGEGYRRMVTMVLLRLLLFLPLVLVPALLAQCAHDCWADWSLLGITDANNCLLEPNVFWGAFSVTQGGRLEPHEFPWVWFFRRSSSM